MTAELPKAKCTFITHLLQTGVGCVFLSLTIVSITVIMSCTSVTSLLIGSDNPLLTQLLVSNKEMPDLNVGAINVAKERTEEGMSEQLIDEGPA